MQQRQTASARTDENKLRAVHADLARRQILRADFPTRAASLQSDHAMVRGDPAAFLLAEPAEQLARDLAEVHIGPRIHLRRGDGHIAAAFEEQRSPACDLRAVGGVFHLAEEMVRRHPGVSGLQKVHLLVAVHKADVLDRVDEVLRPLRHPARDGVAPELLRVFELLENLDHLVHVHRTVGFALRRVAQFADARVARARIVPAVRAFLREPVGDLVELDGEARIKALQQSPEICGHDAAADQDDVRVFDVRGVWHQRLI